MWCKKNEDGMLDTALIDATLAGKREAFDSLMIKYQARVRSVVSHYIADPHEIYDVAQDAFFNAYRGLETYNHRAPFQYWIYRIAINAAKRHLRKNKEEAVTTSVNFFDEEKFTLATLIQDINTPENLLTCNEIEQRILSTIENLDSNLRVTILLREMVGLRYGEIASLLDVPIGTVQSRLFRARKALREDIAKL